MACRKNPCHCQGLDKAGCVHYEPKKFADSLPEFDGMHVTPADGRAALAAYQRGVAAGSPDILGFAAVTPGAQLDADLAEAKACLRELWERTPNEPLMALGKRIRAVLGEPEPVDVIADARLRNAVRMAINILQLLNPTPTVQQVIELLQKALADV